MKTVLLVGLFLLGWAESNSINSNDYKRIEESINRAQTAVTMEQFNQHIKDFPYTATRFDIEAFNQHEKDGRWIYTRSDGVLVKK